MSQDDNRSHRLAILTASEIDDLFGLPRFTEEDRRLYFDLTGNQPIALTSPSDAVLRRILAF